MDSHGEQTRYTVQMTRFRKQTRCKLSGILNIWEVQRTFASIEGNGLSERLN